MVRLYLPLLILKLFCFYHAYKNNAEYFWFLVIFIVPVLGPLAYLYKAFYNRENVENVSESFLGLLNSNHEIDKLEKDEKYSSTIENRTKLADAYTSAKRYKEAKSMYQSCLVGFNAEDPDLLSMLLRVNYLDKTYGEVVNIGAKIKDEPYFNKTDESIAYALSLHHVGKTKEANSQFKKMDIPFSNYKQRIEYCHFLQETGNESECIEMLHLLRDEIEHMSRSEQRMKRNEYRQIKTMLNS